MFCGHCMMDVPEKAKFCMKCGTKVGEMTCETCGAALPNGSRFCMECGAKMCAAISADGKKMHKVTFSPQNPINWDWMNFSVYINRSKQFDIFRGQRVAIQLEEKKHTIKIEWEVSLPREIKATEFEIDLKENLVIQWNLEPWKGKMAYFIQTDMELL